MAATAHYLAPRHGLRYPGVTPPDSACHHRSAAPNTARRCRPPAGLLRTSLPGETLPPSALSVQVPDFESFPPLIQRGCLIRKCRASSRCLRIGFIVCHVTGVTEPTPLRFLFVGPAVRLRLPPDPASRRAPLPSTHRSPCRVGRGLGMLGAHRTSWREPMPAAQSGRRRGHPAVPPHHRYVRSGYRGRRRCWKSASLTQEEAAAAMAWWGNSAKPGTLGNPAETSMPRAANSACASSTRSSARPSA